MKNEGTVSRDVLVTGALGGMGRQTVRRLSEQGFRVFALDLAPKDEGSGLIEELGESRVIPIYADLTNEQSVLLAFDEVKKYTDRLAFILHFAGIYMLDSLVEMSRESWEKIFRVNVGGAFLVNKIFLPLLSRGSRILITTSELAPLDPLPFTGIYAITKAALDKYAYSLRMELQLLGIEVAVLRAGAVSTDMLGVSTSALDSFCESTKLYSCNAARFKSIVERVEARSISTEKLAARVSKILKKRRMRFAYSINRNPLLRLLGILPKRIQLWAIRLVLK